MICLAGVAVASSERGAPLRLLLVEGIAVRVVLGVSWANGLMSAPDMDMMTLRDLVG